jgi:hypothetical protein
MVIDECTLRFQGMASARRGLRLKPEGSGVEINSILSLYNQSYGGVDRHDALVVLQQRVLPEDVLR